MVGILLFTKPKLTFIKNVGRFQEFFDTHTLLFQIIYLDWREVKLVVNFHILPCHLSCKQNRPLPSSKDIFIMEINGFTDEPPNSISKLGNLGNDKNPAKYSKCAKLKHIHGQAWRSLLRSRERHMVKPIKLSII